MAESQLPERLRQQRAELRPDTVAIERAVCKRTFDLWKSTPAGPQRVGRGGVLEDGTVVLAQEGKPVRWLPLSRLRQFHHGTIKLVWTWFDTTRRRDG